MPRSLLKSAIRAIPFVMMLGIGFASFYGLSSARRPPSPRTVERLAPLVQTVTVAAGDAALHIEVQGEAVPFRHVSLSAEIAGRIKEKTERCQAGHFVEEGCLLLRIDPSDYELEVQRVRESIKESEVRVEESDVQFANNEQLVKLARDDVDLQEKELARVKSLLKQRVTSQATLDTAQRARIQARNALQTLENQSRLFRTQRNRFLREKGRLLVELEKALLNLERTEIRAPISGIITEDSVEKDDYVQKGSALLRLEDTSRVEVSFDLKLDELRWIWASVGQDESSAVGGSYSLPPLPVEIQVQVYGQTFAWPAVLARYDGTGINPATRTVPCMAVVEDPRGGRFVGAESKAGRLPGPPALLRGMFVNVEVSVPTTDPLIELPVTALRPGNRVWVWDDDRLAIRNVQPAQVTDDRILIFPSASELAEGDRVIVSALPLPVDGMQIRDPATVADTSNRETRNATKSAPTEVAR